MHMGQTGRLRACVFTELKWQPKETYAFMSMQVYENTDIQKCVVQMSEPTYVQPDSTAGDISTSWCHEARSSRQFL